MTKKLVPVKMVAERLGVSPKTIYDQAAKGVIPSIKVGRAVRFDPEAVEEFVQKGGSRDAS